MDEYKEYLYARRPELRSIDAGDLSAQLTIREKLKCRSFRWFMTEVAFDIVNLYPLIEPPATAEGEVSARRSSSREACGYPPVEPPATDERGEYPSIAPQLTAH